MSEKLLTAPFSIRLWVPQKAALEAEASRLGIPFQQHLRDRLDVTTAVQAPLDTMRKELAYALGKLRPGAGGGAPGSASPASGGVVTDALFVELALAMRQVLNPTQLRSIQNEIVELGLTPWSTGEGR
ncbi:MAG: hypothetical protein Q8R98_18165 [Rubrivivax sp.]|nr:hypothetical protein [Rubrivivax sp.]